MEDQPKREAASDRQAAEKPKGILALLKQLRESTFLAFVGGIALYILLGFVLWWFLDQYIDPSSIEEEDKAKAATARKDLFQALGFIMAGVAGVVGVYFTWRNLRQTQESTQQTQKNAEETLRLTEQGQITERFTRAIDQLGATDDEGKPKLEIRLGGIYALERIAKDSPERDYSTVMEVLTAYARENAPHYPRSLAQEAQEAAKREEGREQDEGDEPQKLDVPQEHRAAVRAIADVIRRLHGKDGTPEQYIDQVRLDLHNTNLHRANLHGAKLTRANLIKANLQEANLQEANLSGADYRAGYARGSRVQLPRAQLRQDPVRREGDRADKVRA